MKKTHFYSLVVVLLGLGFGGFFYKWKVLQFPLVEDAQTITWNVEAKVSFYGSGKGTKISLLVPQNSENVLILDESFISSGFGVSADQVDENRKVTWSVRKANGRQTLFYKARIKLNPEPSNARIKLHSEFQSQFKDATLTAAKSILDRVSEKANDTEFFVGELVKELRKKDLEGETKSLLGKNPSSQKFSRVLVSLLAVKQIPARVVNGVRLGSDIRNAELLQWIEVWDQSLRKKFSFSLQGKIIDDTMFLPWWYGSETLVTRNGGRAVQAQIAIAASEDEALTNALVSSDVLASSLIDFSIFRLPITTQLVYRTLFLIPIGALVVVFLRNMVGLTSFGTFMPVLIALSFRETQLLWGLILFSIVTFCGLGARFYLEQFKLLLVPRLASTLTIVVISMLLLSVLSFKLNIAHGLSIALFPMVILTMTIERMSITWDEKGAAEAFRQALGTLLISSLCYLVMGVKALEHLLFVFPELLFVVLAICLLSGRYTGFRLLELKRFRELSSIEYARKGN